MKKIILVIFYFHVVLCSAQTNKYWQVNESWSILRVQQYGGPEVDYLSIEYWGISGDTIISGKTYKKVNIKKKEGYPIVFNDAPIQVSSNNVDYLLSEKNDTITVIDIMLQDTIQIFYNLVLSYIYQKNSANSFAEYITINNVSDSFNLNGVFRRYVTTDYGNTYEGAIGGFSYAITNVLQFDGSNLLTCYSANDTNYVVFVGGEILSGAYLNQTVVNDTAIIGDCTLEGVYVTYGVEDMNNDLIKISPNPAKDYLMFTFSSQNQEQFSYTVFTIQGKPIESGIIKLQSPQLDVSAYPPGIYFIRFMQDEVSSTIKFVKK